MGKKSLDVIFASQFKKDCKKYKKTKLLAEVFQIVQILVAMKKLPDKYRDHSLSGKLRGYRECHVKPDLLLIYKIESENIKLARLGSHSDLFN